MTQQPVSAEGWDCHVHVFDAAAPAAPGHYQPGAALLPEIEALAGPHGVGHLVLVQPSVYGTDNSVLLRALEAGGRRHRGVAVLDEAVSEKEIDDLHERGVRGVRFNLVSPVGNAATALPRLAPLLAERGWHVQWYARTEQLQHIADLQARTGLPFVLDHLAGLTAGDQEDASLWASLQRLAGAGAWLKLSGWYRLRSTHPYLDLVPIIQRAHALFGDHLVWGSDWPHTSFDAGDRPAYEALLHPVTVALGEANAHRILRTNPRALYAEA
jgi:predicted TIM-barrel fold metal-dependent hydrolase